MVEKFCDKKVYSMSALKLAFVGDAVFELAVRNLIVQKSISDIGEINKLKVKYVCCEAQSKFFRKIEHILSEKEMSIYKRGRNAHVNNTPKNFSAVDYHIATGVESLFGYLYLLGQHERIDELISYIDFS